MTFREFTSEVYECVCLPKLAASTRVRYVGVLRNYLLPAFADVQIEGISTLAADRFLVALAGDAEASLSAESIDKIRDVLSGILAAAVRYGFIVRNPVQGLRLPRQPRRWPKPFLRQADLELLVSEMAEPYATAVYVAAYTGLRVSELAGLRWRDVGPDSITVRERICRGDRGPTKTPASAATVPVAGSVIERLERLKTLRVPVRAGRATRWYAAVKNAGPEDLVLQSARTAGPLHDGNVLRRHIKPAAARIGAPWVNWQVLRRSFACWLKLAGADVKDAQGLMRHARASTTLDIYQQFVPESQRQVVDRLDALARNGGYTP